MWTEILQQTLPVLPNTAGRRCPAALISTVRPAVALDREHVNQYDTLGQYKFNEPVSETLFTGPNFERDAAPSHHLF